MYRMLDPKSGLGLHNPLSMDAPNEFYTKKLRFAPGVLKGFKHLLERGFRHFQNHSSNSPHRVGFKSGLFSAVNSLPFLPSRRSLRSRLMQQNVSTTVSALASLASCVVEHEQCRLNARPKIPFLLFAFLMDFEKCKINLLKVILFGFSIMKYKRKCKGNQ